MDALGTTRYAYSADGLLAYEDGPWENDAVSYVHTNGLRMSLALEQPNGAAWTNGYAYDWTRRLTNITSPAGSFGYRYYAGMNWRGAGVGADPEPVPAQRGGDYAQL